MKVRSDFVTNSSSSSFIIGQKDDASVTVDFAYGLIRELYCEMLDKKEKLLKYTKGNPYLGIAYSEDSKSFQFTDKNRAYKKEREICHMIEQNFGISFYDNFGYDLEWLCCKNYAEYETYWLRKLENSDDNRWIHAPFTIADFNNTGEITWFHDSSKGHIIKGKHDISAGSEIYEWYVYDNDFDEVIDCLGPESVGYKTACQTLGRVCIYSECGYIPDYVVQKLHEYCTYSCNHMG